MLLYILIEFSQAIEPYIFTDLGLRQFIGDKAAIKRGQSQMYLNYTEREQVRDNLLAQRY